MLGKRINGRIGWWHQRFIRDNPDVVEDLRTAGDRHETPAIDPANPEDRKAVMRALGLGGHPSCHTFCHRCNNPKSFPAYLSGCPHCGCTMAESRMPATSAPPIDTARPGAAIAAMQEATDTGWRSPIFFRDKPLLDSAGNEVRVGDWMTHVCGGKAMPMKVASITGDGRVRMKGYPESLFDRFDIVRNWTKCAPPDDPPQPDKTPRYFCPCTNPMVLMGVLSETPDTITRQCPRCSGEQEFPAIKPVFNTYVYTYGTGSGIDEITDRLDTVRMYGHDVERVLIAPEYHRQIWDESAAILRRVRDRTYRPDRHLRIAGVSCDADPGVKPGTFALMLKPQA